MDETARDITLSFDSLIEELGAKLVGWTETLVRMVPNFVLALLVLVLAWGVARVARGAAASTTRRISGEPQLAYLVGLVASAAAWISGISIALGVMQLDKTVTSLLAGVGIVGLALGFAFQEIAADFLSGMLLAMRRPYRVGDLVEIAGHRGVVADLDLRTTMIRALTGELVRIPNKQVFGNALVNFSRAPARRVDVEVGVSYGSDLPKVRDVTREALRRVSSRLPDRDVEVLFTGFGESSIDLVARFWVPSRTERDWFASRSEAIVAIKQAYDAADITIPFPIRTLDFGIVGGVPLSAELSEMQLGERRGEASR